MRRHIQDLLLEENEAIASAAQSMKVKFVERFGSGELGSVLLEHASLGPNRVRKGIPRYALYAMVLDPRFKELEILTEDERRQLWEWIKEDASKMAPTPPSSNTNNVNTSNRSNAICPFKLSRIGQDNQQRNSNTNLIHNINNDIEDNSINQNESNNSTISNIRSNINREIDAEIERYLRRREPTNL